MQYKLQGSFKGTQPVVYLGDPGSANGLKSGIQLGICECIVVIQDRLLLILEVVYVFKFRKLSAYLLGTP